jgi:hypothetical protein
MKTGLNPNGLGLAKVGDMANKVDLRFRLRLAQPSLFGSWSAEF